MTISEFISHLDQQPWKLNYLQNHFEFSKHHPSHNSVICYDFINDAFSWVNTPEDGEFWSAIYKNNYTCSTTNLTVHSLTSALRTHFSPTHPELFI